jgi:enolase
VFVTSTVGDEGGFAPPCDNREGCELIMEAITQAGYQGKCKIGLDVAASEFKVKGQDSYDLDFKYDGNIISGEELGNLYQSLAADFPIVTIEDPFDEVRQMPHPNRAWFVCRVELCMFNADPRKIFSLV